MVSFNIHASAAITGTPGATTYLRGDGTWTTPSGTTYTANETNITLSGTEFQLKNKTSYASIGGIDFVPNRPGSDEYKNLGVRLEADSVDADTYKATIQLPHGAVVTAAIVYGTTTSETWSLDRYNLTSSTTSSNLASGNIDAQDTSISNATVDNSNYIYVFSTSSLDDGEKIDGARITYTTDYD